MNERQRVKELERLSAYLDGELNETEQQQIESRLASEPEVFEIYEGLRKTKLLFSRLRRVRAPRAFTLTPEMVKVRKQKQPFFTSIRWATSVAAILLVVMFGADLLLGGTFAARSTMESAPPMEQSLEMQDEATLAEEIPEAKAAEPDPLIFWGVPGSGGGGDSEAYGLGGGGDAGINEQTIPEEPSGGGDLPPETQTDMRSAEDTEGESLILGINTDQAEEEMYTIERVDEEPSPRWLAALTPLRWAEIGLAVVILTGVIILLVGKRS